MGSVKVVPRIVTTEVNIPPWPTVITRLEPHSFRVSVSGSHTQAFCEATIQFHLQAIVTGRVTSKQ